MATITKVEGKTKVSFQVRYRVNGKQKTKSFSSFDNTKTSEKKAEKQAKEFAKKLESQKTLGIIKEESSKTFEEYAREYREIYVMRKKRSTIKNFDYQLNTILKDIGNMKLKDITPSYLDNYFINLKKQDYSNSILLTRKSIIQLILKSAYKKDLIINNPIEKMDFTFSSKNKKETRIVNSDELRLFLNEISKHPKYKYFTLLALYTGMRRGEVVALKWENVNFDKRELYVKETLNTYGEFTDPKTLRSKRIIYLHDSLFELLHEIKFMIDANKRYFGNTYEDNDLVICHEDGKVIATNTISGVFKRINERFNIDVTPHKLRHTFATLMRNTEIKDLQQLMGHSTTEMTINTYTHHNKFMKETEDKLNNTFKNIYEVL